MKTTLLLISLLSITPVFANSIATEVVLNLNSLLSDTYNEGDGTAEATTASCQFLRGDSKTRTIFCSVLFTVQPNRDSNYKSEVKCTSLKFKLSQNFRNPDLISGWDECSDKLNNVLEF